MVHVRLGDDLKSIVERHVAEGRTVPEADYFAEAVRRYAEDLEAETDLIAIAEAGIADAEAGRCTLIETEADSEALHQRIMDGVRATLAGDSSQVAYRLVGQAEIGVARIILESVRRFGFDAAERYEQFMLATRATLGQAPTDAASHEISDVPGVQVYPLQLGHHLVEPRFRVGRPRHIVVYRVAPDGIVEIPGVAHDRMLIGRSARRMQRDADR